MGVKGVGRLKVLGQVLPHGKYSTYVIGIIIVTIILSNLVNTYYVPRTEKHVRPHLLLAASGDRLVLAPLDS